MTEELGFSKSRDFVRAVHGLYNMEAVRETLYNAPRVLDVRDQKYRGGPQHWNKEILYPESGIMQALESHIVYFGPYGRSAKHGHQNGAVFYILEGEGYEIHDEKRYDWRAGDVVIVHNACVHQHFNATDRPAKALVIKSKPPFMFFHLLWQRNVEMPPKEPAPGFEEFDLPAGEI